MTATREGGGDTDEVLAWRRPEVERDAAGLVGVETALADAHGVLRRDSEGRQWVPRVWLHALRAGRINPRGVQELLDLRVRTGRGDIPVFGIATCTTCLGDGVLGPTGYTAPVRSVASGAKGVPCRICGGLGRVLRCIP